MRTIWQRFLSLFRRGRLDRELGEEIGIQPADPLAFLATAGVLAAIGLAAAFVPALRAATLAPIQVLRHE
jgi:ABC-type lipoprotein release transport system permease subunit